MKQATVIQARPGWKIVTKIQEVDKLVYEEVIAWTAIVYDSTVREHTVENITSLFPVGVLAAAYTEDDEYALRDPEGRIIFIEDCFFEGADAEKEAIEYFKELEQRELSR
jgi:hypothetical protein